jgi:O-antigen/teichoic acid export membrane protein
MLVSLYTVRAVFQVLGVVDYGIYNVVAGVVIMFNFLSSAMANSSQRFFSYDLGQKDFKRLQQSFSISVLIFISIALLIMALSETLGLWFLVNKMVIPESRMEAALYVFQFTIISFLFTLIQTPYMAMIIAHENMNVYAFVSVFEVCLKLILVILLKFFKVDKLVLYSLLMSIVTCLNFLIYQGICKRKYQECKFIFFFDKDLFKLILSYSGWNLFGALSNVLKNQGINILLNLYFGPTVNAARSIAQQVSGAVTSFSNNFVTAVRPQIIKQYAAGEHEEMLVLLFRSSKMTAFLLYLFILPLLIELPTVINLWLGELPEYVVLFTRLILIDALLNSISSPMQTAVQATGKIKKYQFCVGGILLLNLPISYIYLKMGASPEYVLIVGIIITFFAFFIRLNIAKRLVGFSFSSFLKRVVAPIFLVFSLSSIGPLLYSCYHMANLLRLFSTIILSIFSVLVFVMVIGLTKTERNIFFGIVRNKISKKYKK